MNLTDTHSHLDYFQKRGMLESIVANAKTEGVNRIINVSASPDDWNCYEKISKQHFGFIDWAIGIHPSDIDENSDLALDALASYFIGANTPVAIGEIGLDYHFLPKDRLQAEEIIARQKEIFRRQIRLAIDLNAPICVHARDAVDDSIEIMAEENFDFSRAVFHCFAGNLEQIKHLNSCGGRASFTGIITYPNAEEMRQCMLTQGLGTVMFETDCPYLAPVPMRKNVNEPAFVAHTIDFAAKLFGISKEELGDISTKNAYNFFNLK